MAFLRYLEDEAIHIIREACASAEKPGMLYSIGKDSSVLLHLVLKAFYPAKPKMKFVHIDTGWKFREMISFRDNIFKKYELDSHVWQNQEGLQQGINPFDHGSKVHTDIMKTQALKQSLNHFKFDFIFGGARRDEEKSRAKERIFSLRNAFHAWEPDSQRPELWNIYNTKLSFGSSMRVFPISNWTELDVWEYIKAEQIDIVPLYFSKKRPFVVRDDMIMCIDDDRMKILPGEKVYEENIRFRTLGCYPLTAGIRSEATNLDEIIQELKDSTSSERSGRLIDKDQSGAMEKKKKDGYF